MKQTLENLIQEGLAALGVEGVKFTVEHPANIAFGDYSTNAGIVSKKAPELLEWLTANKPAEVESVELKAGFINFHLSKRFFAQKIGEIIEKGHSFGKGEHAQGFKVMVEYTDANLFKEFHIGHLMSNTIGESIARLLEWNNAEVQRANYQGDVGLHVAKAIWGKLQKPEMSWGEAYAFGHRNYEENKSQIDEINKKVYKRNDPQINDLYTEGAKHSLEAFEEIYRRLGMKVKNHAGAGRYFDWYFFESMAWNVGQIIVDSNTPAVFEKSEGAIVFKGEKHNPTLHTRVFVNSQGLPTYEAKELGLFSFKADKFPEGRSITITAHEQAEYFKVVRAAAQLIPQLKNIADRTQHLTHGMLRLSTGKMSSRTGNVIAAESLIDEVKEKTKGNEEVAIGAIKYMILRSNIGSDIVFDIEKSVSTEGDSGVYLQYAHTRANSVLEKAGRKGNARGERAETHGIEKLLYRFPEVVERAGAEYAPNLITTYLTELAASFNNFYAHEQVISDDAEAPYRLAIVEAFRNVMKNGLTVLGIDAPERM